MSDIVVVRAVTRERLVDPLYRSGKRDAWGKRELNDHFIGAFEIKDGTAYSRSTAETTRRNVCGSSGSGRTAACKASFTQPAKYA